jgi:hypothetical protein
MLRLATAVESSVSLGSHPSMHIANPFPLISPSISVPSMPMFVIISSASFLKKHKPVIIAVQVEKEQSCCSKCGVWEVEWTVILTTSAPQPDKLVYDEDTGTYHVVVVE